ncbi:MAG: hypothetical protein R2695_01780 [Acidimicrobiales bacterium]
MVAGLEPISPWWSGLLALASSLRDPDPAAPSHVPGRTAADDPPSPDVERPQPRPAGGSSDDDLPSMAPADALAEMTRRHADAVYRVAPRSREATSWPRTWRRTPC